MDGVPVQTDGEQQSEAVVVEVAEAVFDALDLLTQALVASVGALLTPVRLVEVQ